MAIDEAKIAKVIFEHQGIGAWHVHHFEYGFVEMSAQGLSGE
jgi:hypothetical protein